MSKSKIYKIKLTLCGFLFFLVANVVAKWPDTYVHIVVCDVGQGDAILIYQGFFQVLIDSGPDDRVLTCLSKNMPLWDRTMELIVVTHYDSDHIGGFGDVLDAYEVKTILASSDFKDSNMFRELKILFEHELQSGAILKKPFFGDTISLQSGATFTILSPWFGNDNNEKSEISATFKQKTTELADFGVKNDKNAEIHLSDIKSSNELIQESKNDRSIVLLFEYNEIKAFLAGDLELEGEEALMSQGLITPVSILKTGHHGAKTSSGSDFIRQLAPEISLISAGKNNKYGHPHAQTLEKLAKMGVLVARTDKQGEIEVVTDGFSYWVVDN